MTVIHHCLGNKLKNFKGNNILVAMLILCNLKPVIVYHLKRTLIICRSILNDFAIYLTSFVFFNWIIFILYTDFNNLEFM
jgi:hypothetical protein